MNTRLRDLFQSYADAFYRLWISRRSTEGLPAEGARDRRVRRGLAATLSLLGFILLIEVVVAPGLLFRWPLRARLQGGEQAEASIESATWAPGLANKEPEQGIRRQRLRDTIRARLGEYQKAVAELHVEWDQTCRTAHDEIAVDL